MAALLDRLAAEPAPPIEEQPLRQARALAGRLLDVLDTPGPEVARVHGATVDGPGGPVPVRWYDPWGGTDGLPIVVLIHGGGWVLGSLDEEDRSARRLCAGTGARVLSVGYRLAPEHPFPAPLDDVCAAVAHAASVAPAVAVCGESAGGNLAAAACLRARDEGGPAIALQVLVCPALDARCDTASYVEFADGHLLTASAMRWFWSCYLGVADVGVGGAEPDAHASPAHAADVTGLPPARVLTAEADPLRDEAEAYSRRLRDAGIDVVTSRYQGMVHGFTGMGAITASARYATDEMCHALREALALPVPFTGTRSPGG